jgi:Fur family transcriptional regulator, peroxide stress response regulator
MGIRRIPALSKAEVNQRIEDLGILCREQHKPFTRHRKAVLQMVLDLGCHPSAETVYRSIASRNAGVSRATVYRTLENLAKAGAVLKLDLGGNAIRYDGRIALHHHFVCIHCGEVIDISSPELDSISIPDSGNMGLVVSDLRVQLSGYCRDCSKKLR